MDTPTTEEGRRWLDNPDWWLVEGEREQARGCILAIEREAAAAAEARLAEATSLLHKAKVIAGAGSPLYEAIAAFLAPPKEPKP